VSAEEMLQEQGLHDDKIGVYSTI